MPLLFAYGINRFSHDVAHISLKFMTDTSGVGNRLYYVAFNHLRGHDLELNVQFYSAA